MSDSTPKQIPEQVIPYGYCHCGCGQKTKLAVKTDRQYNHVKDTPQRYLKGHGNSSPAHLAKMTAAKIEKAFVNNLSQTYLIDKDSGCWNWKHNVNHKGYGYLAVNGRLESAHRHFYTISHGPIPEGLEIDHLCNNRCCVNPSHLEAVTHLENLHRGRIRRLEDKQN